MLFGVLSKAFRGENEAWQMIQVSVLGVAETSLRV